ncbi:MAG: hypothetical protein ACJAS1_001607 [Oleiphilaceae bacterium]|jgi:hypothetical protein
MAAPDYKIYDVIANEIGLNAESDSSYDSNNAIVEVAKVLKVSEGLIRSAYGRVQKGAKEVKL